MDFNSIKDIGLSLATMLTTLASAGPWGIAAMGVAIVGVLGGLTYLIFKFNKFIDAADMDKAGSDAGQTAVSLKNQLTKIKNKIDAFKNRNKEKKK